MSEDRQKYWAWLMEFGNSSPYYQLVEMKVVELGEGWARMTMPVSTKLFHQGGVVQGGAIASVADAATAYALFSMVEMEDNVSTVELKINYLRPVTRGELTANARVVHKGKRIAVADVEVCQDDGKMVARGMATMMIVQNGRKTEG